ncbi:uncharacterized protein LOC105697274 [Orussus abietinus]|uniref:uncharacterized protein LOC105697274 n=1 Tax=Orussus abietinus TaxID=222816 RepID=UPI00062660CC|nr:uncharacterized protein LOC105697274 [Orussus abietinus]
MQIYIVLLCIALVATTVAMIVLSPHIQSTDENEIEDSGNGCHCKNYTCTCCEYIDTPEIGINGTLCFVWSYLPDQYGIAIIMTYNNRTLYNETISAENPLPICIYEIEDLHLDLCLRFYNLYIKSHCFTGCVKVEVGLIIIHIFHLDLGCFKLGSCSDTHFIQDAITNDIATVRKELKDLKKVPMVERI